MKRTEMVKKSKDFQSIINYKHFYNFFVSVTGFNFSSESFADISFSNFDSDLSVT